MEFKDIGKEELKELNLYPIHKINQYRLFEQVGYLSIYVTLPYKNKKFFFPRLDSDGEICYRPQNSEDYKRFKKVEIKPFLEMSREDFEKTCFFGQKTIMKLLWLQKYLKGEVKGKYNPLDYESYKDVLNIEEIYKRDKDIEKLTLQIKQLKEENYLLKQKILYQEKELTSCEKTKQKFIQLKRQTEKLLQGLQEL